MRKLIWTLPFLFLLFLPSLTEKATSTSMEVDGRVITGKINNVQDIEECVRIIEKNNAAVNNKQLNDYAETLVHSARAASVKELKTVFETYDLQVEIQNIKVKTHEQEYIVFEIEQRTVNNNEADFRNHVSTALTTFVKEDGTWKIAETAMSDTTFLSG